MKITKQLKFWMQANSFLGIVAALYLIYLGVHLSMAWIGLGINVYGLLNWIFIKEDENDNNQTPQ